MKTWSLADVFDVFKKVEQLTRPPRRDEPATTERPDCSCGLGDGVKLREHWSSCAVWDDDQVAKLADMEAGMDRLKAEEAHPAQSVRAQFDGMFIAVAEPQGGLGNFPGLDDRLTDELAGMQIWTAPKDTTQEDILAQLCQLTYLVEDLRNIIQSSPAASAAGVSPSEACDIPSPSPSEGRSPKPQQ